MPGAVREPQEGQRGWSHVNSGVGAVRDEGGLCERRAVHRSGERLVGLSRGSGTLRVGNHWKAPSRAMT